MGPCVRRDEAPRDTVRLPRTHSNPYRALHTASPRAIAAALRIADMLAL